MDRGGDPADYPILNEDRPRIYPSLRWVWEGFFRLSQTRQRGFSSVQPLTFEAISGYCDFYKYETLEEREEFSHYVMFLDRIFVAEIDSRRPKTPPKQ